MNDEETLLLAQARKVNGPGELMEQLHQLKKMSEQTGIYEYSILYQLGNQRSMIRLDFSQEPCHFYYKDTLGRPMTKAVENTIAEFLWHHCGEKDRHPSQTQWWERTKKEKKIVEDAFDLDAAVRNSIHGFFAKPADKNTVQPTSSVPSKKPS